MRANIGVLIATIAHIAQRHLATSPINIRDCGISIVDISACVRFSGETETRLVKLVSELTHMRRIRIRDASISTAVGRPTSALEVHR